MVVYQFTIDKLTIKDTSNWFLCRRGHIGPHIFILFCLSVFSLFKCYIWPCMLHSCGHNLVFYKVLALYIQKIVFYNFAWFYTVYHLKSSYYVLFSELIWNKNESMNQSDSVITLATGACVEIVPTPT